MAAYTVGRLHWSDILVIGLYYIISLIIGVYSICRSKNSLQSFFLAGRSITWLPIGLSLFASNIGSINFVGIAGSGAASGLAVIMFEWNAVFLLLILAWFFLPVYISSGIYTIPEYLHHRFGGVRLRIYLSFIAVLTYIFAVMSSDLYSGAIFIQQTLGWNIYVGVALLLGTTILFTTLGGLLTVVLTDAFAVIVMVIGGFVLFILAMIEVGGLGELKDLYMAAIPNETIINTTCGFPREDSWNIFRDNWTADFPGLGTFLRTSLMGSLWYWCCNQVLVQRALAAKNITHAKAGSILASYLKLTPLLIMVLPGMISRALYPDEVGCATEETCREVCGNPAGCSNIAYPKLVIEILPHGLRGLLLAAMIAAVISSLTSVFNSSSSIFTMDIWSRLRPRATEKELLIVGKIFIIILTAISVIWIPIMESAEGGQIYKYSVAANGLFGGPTCALFIVAVFWKRINEKGAFWGLMAGQAWGLCRFILDAIYPVPHCSVPDERPALLRDWHVYYHVCSQVILTILVAAIISYLTKPIPDHMLIGSTYWTRFDQRQEHPLDDIDSNPNDKSGFCLEDVQNSEEVKTKYTEKMSLKCDTNKVEGYVVTTTKSKTVLNWLWECLCAGNIDKVDMTAEKTFENSDNVTVRLNSLRQTTKATVLLNINAILVMTITVAAYICFW